MPINLAEYTEDLLMERFQEQPGMDRSAARERIRALLAEYAPPTLANLPANQRAALRIAIQYALDNPSQVDLVRGDVREALVEVLAGLA
jgi:hypothetical protein